MGQAEKIFEDTKVKVTEYSDAAMEKVNNCKVSWKMDQPHSFSAQKFKNFNYPYLIIHRGEF